MPTAPASSTLSGIGSRVAAVRCVLASQGPGGQAMTAGPRLPSRTFPLLSVVCAPRCGLRRLGRGIAERELATVREGDLRRARARVAIARGEAADTDAGPSGQRVAVPAAAQQRARRAALHPPGL